MLWYMSLPATAWQLLKPTNPDEFWEMVTAILTMGLIIVAARGLRSLKLAKTDLLTRSQREARACAITRCEEMANDLIKGNSDLVTRFAELKKPVFVQRPEDVVFDDTTKLVERARIWVADVPPDVIGDCTRLLNRLEAWSMYFTTGVADHDIAFGPCGPVFCAMVVRYYPILLLARSGRSSGKFPNTVQLFKSWTALIDNEKDGIQMKAVLENLKANQARREMAPVLPRPLGTGL